MRVSAPVDHLGDISTSTAQHTSIMNTVEGFFGVGAILFFTCASAVLAPLAIDPTVMPSIWTTPSSAQAGHAGIDFLHPL